MLVIASVPIRIRILSTFWCGPLPLSMREKLSFASSRSLSLNSSLSLCLGAALRPFFVLLRLPILLFSLLDWNRRLTGFARSMPTQSCCVKSLFLLASSHWRSMSISGALCFPSCKSVGLLVHLHVAPASEQQVTTNASMDANFCIRVRRRTAQKIF